MATLLKWVGGIWAVLGIGNLVGLPWATAGEGLLAAGLMFNFLLFIFPGLIVYGIGAAIGKKREHPAPSETKSAETRLHELSSLKEKGLISGEEFETRRKGILNDV